MNDPLAGTAWSAPQTVAGFGTSPPNDTLMGFAKAELMRSPGGQAIDIGCGAARNAVPLAEQGWQVLGTDWSARMLEAAVARASAAGVASRCQFVLAPMEKLPAADASYDLVIAQGIWNLARSSAQFRAGIAEAARVARPGAGLFVFTFSRNTLASGIQPLPGELFVFKEFSGQPQCFLTREQLTGELALAGFTPDDGVPFTEHNLPSKTCLHANRPPVIWEAAFRRR